MKLEEVKKKIDRIHPNGTLQTQIVDVMNGLLELIGTLQGESSKASIEVPGMNPSPVKPPMLKTFDSKDPRENPDLKPSNSIVETIIKLKEKSK